jgi:hypothetical protein
MIWQHLCRPRIRCTWTTRTDFASDHAVPSTAEEDNWVSSWIVGKPHLTLQRLTPTTSCGPETHEPSNLPITRLSGNVGEETLVTQRKRVYCDFSYDLRE